MKLAVIGGAGVRAVFLAGGVAARAAETGIDKLALHDIDADRLSLIGPLCARAAALADPRLEVETQLDIEKALDGAGAVIATFRIGGDRSRVGDERLARKYGLLPQETTGLGGFLMAMRTVPALRDYCDKIRAIAPDAMVFNFANPSGLVAQAMRMAGHDRVVGVCDTPSSTNIRIAAALGLDPSELDIRWAGLNHLSWIFGIRKGGREILPGLLEDGAFLGSVPELAMFDRDLLRRLGCIPNEYLYYYYYRERALANIGSGGATRGEFIKANNEALFAALSRIDPSRDPDRGLAVHADFMGRRESSYMSVETGKAPAGAGGSATGKAPADSRAAGRDAADAGAGYAKVVLDLLEARRSGREATVVLSVPNAGALPFLEKDDVVEISCRATKAGPVPLDPGPVPEHARLLAAQVKSFERRAAAAALESDRAMVRLGAVDALMAHPLIASYSLARAIVEDALAD